jgi:hypothetical protein
MKVVEVDAAFVDANRVLRISIIGHVMCLDIGVICR